MFPDEFEDGAMRKYLLIALLLVTVMGASWYVTSGLLADSEQAVLVEEPGGAAAEAGESGVPSGRILVYVSGAVKKPGVYELPAGTRAYEAVEAAGNVIPYADVDNVNLSAELVDGEQFHVPLDPNRVSAAAGTAGSLVNINTAGKTELDTLPGVGEVTAQKILDYRNAHGPFQTKEDIKNVPSIGDGKYAKLADRITT